MSASKKKIFLKGQLMKGVKNDKETKSLRTWIEEKHTLEINYPSLDVGDTGIAVEQVMIKEEYPMLEDDDQIKTASENPLLLEIKVEDVNLNEEPENLNNQQNTPTLKRRRKKDKSFNFLRCRSPDRVTRCEMCSKTYNLCDSRTTISEHMRKMHDNIIKCPICLIAFKNLAELRVHKKEHHMNQIFECDICSGEYYCLDQLSEHIIKKHNRENYCELCQSSFDSTDSLAKHNEILHSHSEYTCKFCLSVFKRYTKLAHHKKVNRLNKDKRRCKICLKMLVSHCLMTKHWESHDSNNLYCEFCKKSFTSIQEIINHNQSNHFIAKYYACICCDRKFKSSRSKHQHEKRFGM
jgi:hypothetical protein